MSLFSRIVLWLVLQLGQKLGYGAYGTGVSAQGYNPYQIVQAAPKKAEGEITVSFKDAPPGMRVTDTRSSGIDVNHDVGYTRFGMGG